jgi:hypothetical protein
MSPGWRKGDIERDVRRLFEDGDVENAAMALGRERKAAQQSGDTEAVSAIGALAEELRATLQGRELAWFEAALGKPPPQ